MASFEDVGLNLKSNEDYNDVIIAIEGVQQIGFDVIEDVIGSNRNWLDTEVGEDILGYFDSLSI